MASVFRGQRSGDRSRVVQYDRFWLEAKFSSEAESAHREVCYTCSPRTHQISPRAFRCGIPIAQEHVIYLYACTVRCNILIAREHIKYPTTQTNQMDCNFYEDSDKKF